MAFVCKSLMPILNVAGCCVELSECLSERKIVVYFDHRETQHLHIVGLLLLRVSLRLETADANRELAVVLICQGPYLEVSKSNAESGESYTLLNYLPIM